MRDIQTPKYILMGMGDGAQVAWVIMRNADGALATLAHAYVADDGHPCEAAPDVCTFVRAGDAEQFMAHVEDGTVREYLRVREPLAQARLAWVSAEQFVVNRLSAGTFQ